MMVIFHYGNHVSQGITSKLHHLMNVLILLFCKVVTSIAFTIDGTSYIITTVTNTFDFSHLTQHATNLQLTFRTQTSFRYPIQIIGNFQLHIVANVLILLNTAEQLIEIVFVSSMKQFIQHTEHTAHTFCK